MDDEFHALKRRQAVRDIMKPPKVRVYHMASKINENGDVSALCFARPRAINLSVATWTNRKDAVTCPKCIKALAERSRPADETH